MTERTRGCAGNLIRIRIGMGLLVWLLWRFDLRGVWDYFEDLRISVWATAFLMLPLAHVLSSIRWWILANTLSFPGPWPTYSGTQV